jgi:SsrA-binding protein
MPTIAYNKRANFDYEILEKFEAGLVLRGHEVKSVRTGHVSLKGSYITFKNQSKIGKLPEAFLINAHISLYKHAGRMDGYDPLRSRKILLKKREIEKLMGKKKEQGLTLVPIKIYTKQSLLKLEFGIGRGKKKYDKREDIKKKDIERSTRRLMKKRR